MKKLIVVVALTALIWYNKAHIQELATNVKTWTEDIADAVRGGYDDDED